MIETNENWIPRFRKLSSIRDTHVLLVSTVHLEINIIWKWTITVDYYLFPNITIRSTKPNLTTPNIVNLKNLALVKCTHKY